MEPFTPQGEQGVQIKPQHEVLSEVSVSLMAEGGAVRGTCSLQWPRG